MEQKMILEEVEIKLKNNNLFYQKTPIANGVNLKFASGLILQVFSNNRLCFSGKSDEKLMLKLNEILFQQQNEDMSEEKLWLKHKIALFNRDLLKSKNSQNILKNIELCENILNFIEKHEVK